MIEKCPGAPARVRGAAWHLGSFEQLPQPADPREVVGAEQFGKTVCNRTTVLVVVGPLVELFQIEPEPEFPQRPRSCSQQANECRFECFRARAVHNSGRVAPVGACAEPRAEFAQSGVRFAGRKVRRDGRDRGAEVVSGRLLLGTALATSRVPADKFVFQFLRLVRLDVGRFSGRVFQFLVQVGCRRIDRFHFDGVLRSDKPRQITFGARISVPDEEHRLLARQSAARPEVMNQLFDRPHVVCSWATIRHAQGGRTRQETTRRT